MYFILSQYYRRYFTLHSVEYIICNYNIIQILSLKFKKLILIHFVTYAVHIFDVLSKLILHASRLKSNKRDIHFESVKIKDNHLK